jgi:hypothetical protein
MLKVEKDIHYTTIIIIIIKTNFSTQRNLTRGLRRSEQAA